MQSRLLRCAQSTEVSGHRLFCFPHSQVLLPHCLFFVDVLRFSVGGHKMEFDRELLEVTGKGRGRGRGRGQG